MGEVEQVGDSRWKEQEEEVEGGRRWGKVDGRSRKRRWREGEGEGRWTKNACEVNVGGGNCWWGWGADGGMWKRGEVGRTWRGGGAGGC